MAFVHLNVHSCHSLLAGTLRPAELAALARRRGFASLALTDTNGLYAAVEFQKACAAEGVRPVLGAELTRPRLRRETVDAPRLLDEEGFAPAVRHTNGSSGSRNLFDAPPGAADEDDGPGQATRQDPGGFARERPAGPGDPRHRATLLARNEAGYALLGEILTARHLDDGFDLADALRSAVASGDLYVLCAGESLLRALAPAERAARAARGDGGPPPGEFTGVDAAGPGARLFVELRVGPGGAQHFRLHESLRLAGELGLPAVATGGVFFGEAEDHELHRILCAMRANTDVLRLPAGEAAPPTAWLMDEARLRLALGVPPGRSRSTGAGAGDDPDAADPALAPAAPRAGGLGGDPRLLSAIAVAGRIAADCRVTIPTGRPRPPAFALPKGADGRPQAPDGFLYRLAHEGLRERLGFAPGDRDRRARRALAALRRELHVIRRRGVSAYFLIAWDLVRFGRSRGLASLGRGSAAGSLVSFALGVTHVNPLEHALYFERFLNLERAGLPDFDIDFGSEARYQILDYAFARYGRDRVAMIGTYQTFRPRGAIRHLVGALGLDEEEWNDTIKLLPRWGGCDDLRDKLREDPKTRHLPLDSGEWPRLLELAGRIGGLPRHLGTHPCGIVIAPGPIAHFVPLQRGGQGLAITQWDMHGVEDAGLVKMDVLGQRGLAVIDATSEKVRRNFGRAPRLAGEPPPVEQARGVGGRGGPRAPVGEAAGAVNPFTDPATKALLADGRTEGCFYIESPIMMQILRQARCEGFETLTALSSIIRPGVSNHGGKRQYLLRHLGRQAVSVLHPLLEPALRDTYGCLIYQEQVMRVLQVLGGMTLGEADLFRKVMSGKGGGDPEEFQVRFMAGALQRLEEAGEDEESAGKIAREVCRQVASFAGYAFCKAHSASFARESFESAYWKAHHPAEFMASVIEERGGYYATAEYVEEARRQDLEILPPHVNAGTTETLGIGAGARVLDPAGDCGRPAAACTRGYSDEGSSEFTRVNPADASRDARGRVRVGLSFMGGVREAARGWLAEEGARRAFNSLAELVERARQDPPEAPRRYELARLIRVGALDGLPVERALVAAEGGVGPPRPEVLAALKRLWPDASAARAETEAFALPPWPNGDADALAELRARAKEELRYLGFSPSAHPLLLHPGYEAARARCLSARELDALARAHADGEQARLDTVSLVGLKVSGKRTRTEKGGRLMAFVTFSDETGNFEAVFYPDDYARVARKLRGLGPFVVTGPAEADLGQALVTGKRVEPLGARLLPALGKKRTGR